MELLRWLRWQWRQFETWQKLWFLAMFLMIVGAASYEILFYAGIAIVFSLACKWFVIDRVQASYAEYKRQRDNLFNEIRGDQK